MHELAEILQLIQHQSYARSSDNVWNIQGHIANWDPATGAVDAVIPIYTDEDAVQYVQTPYMPLASAMTGNGFGMQYRPIGGASVTNPTGGEEINIQITDTEIGAIGSASLVFNQSLQIPPSQNLANNTTTPTPPGNGNTQLQPGEFIIRHQTGSYIRFFQNGDIQIVATNNLIMEQQDGSVYKIDPSGNITINSIATMNLNAATAMNLTAPIITIVET